jgi:hypothetical protein
MTTIPSRSKSSLFAELRQMILRTMPEQIFQFLADSMGPDRETDHSTFIESPAPITITESAESRLSQISLMVRKLASCPRVPSDGADTSNGDEGQRTSVGPQFVRVCCRANRRAPRDSVTEHMTNHQIRISSFITISLAERRGDHQMRKMTFRSEMTSSDSRKRHFASALPMK